MATVTGARRRPPELIALAERVKFHRPLTYFLPVAVGGDDRSPAVAVPRPSNGPGDFLALTRSDGFVELPPSPDGFPQGFAVPLYRW
jgi:molybdopterin molybdotransferase